MIFLHDHHANHAAGRPVRGQERLEGLGDDRSPYNMHSTVCQPRRMCRARLARLMRWLAVLPRPAALLARGCFGRHVAQGGVLPQAADDRHARRPQRGFRNGRLA